MAELITRIMGSMAASVSASASASAEEEDDCCPICSLELEPYDMDHPTQCPSKHCHFNFCLKCIEQFIQSTKDDQVASDGNVFHVFLHCPNCRSNLGPSIRDTVLLRKVDKYLKIDDDVRLSASELRVKHSLENDTDISLAVEEARSRETEFFRDHADDTSSYVTQDSIWSLGSMEGYEADLFGVPKSFISRHHSLSEGAKDKDGTLVNMRPDTTLMCGLEFFMTDQEQRFVTSYLVSGDTSKLAAATEMLHYVSALSRQGITPNFKRSSTNSMMGSIKEVIREGNEARRIENEGGGGTRKSAGVLSEMFVPLAKEKRRTREQMNAALKQQFEYMSKFPLPLRMPKYAELTAHKGGFSLTFRDDTWDGTVLDAFCKISVTRSLLGHVSVTKQHGQSRGIRNIVNVGSSKPNGMGQIDTSRPRVIVASISAEGGQQGIMVGDVVSHVNGSEFYGSACDLVRKINSRSEGELLTFAFNADAAVAEALRRRWLLSNPKKK
ncbi:hypothetical protein ACHAXM_006003 [Skeletonema potamos]